MRTLPIAILALGLCVFVLGCKKRMDSTNADGKNGASGDGGGKRGTYTIGKSTTFVTGPVDSSGHIDYAAALNERLRKGVTPENNVCVALYKILGPNPLGAGSVPPAVFTTLGMESPPSKGDYFIGLKQYVEDQSKGDSDSFKSSVAALPQLCEHPWTAGENSIIHGWLKANEKCLSAVAAATQRTQYYHPMIPTTDERGSHGLISSLLPGPAAYRELAQALGARAMLAIGQGNTVSAWHDLITCHRLGRLVGHGAVLIEGLIGIAIEHIAYRAEIAFLDRGKLDTVTIQNCLRDLRALPPRALAADKIELGERFWFLETIMLFDQHGTSHLARINGIGLRPPHGFTDDALNGIDWNPALEFANRAYDRFVDALREKDREKRDQKLGAIENEVNKLQSEFSDGKRTKALQSADLPAGERGIAVGEMLTMMFPAARKVQDAEDRVVQTHDTVVVAFALAWYQRVNGEYPDSLAKLAPKYLSVVPKDIFTENDMIYRPDTNGFLLYSVGVNGRDDGGRGYTDQPQGDDLVVRIPPKP